VVNSIRSGRGLLALEERTGLGRLTDERKLASSELLTLLILGRRTGPSGEDGKLVVITEAFGGEPDIFGTLFVAGEGLGGRGAELDFRVNPANPPPSFLVVGVGDELRTREGESFRPGAGGGGAFLLSLERLRIVVIKGKQQIKSQEIYRVRPYTGETCWVLLLPGDQTIQAPLK
jgi:hypothetical protein